MRGLKVPGLDGLRRAVDRLERREDEFDEAQEALDAAELLLDWGELTIGSAPTVDEEGEEVERDERLIRWEDMTTRPDDPAVLGSTKVEGIEPMELELMMLERAARLASTKKEEAQP